MQLGSGPRIQPGPEPSRSATNQPVPRDYQRGSSPRMPSAVCPTNPWTSALFAGWNPPPRTSRYSRSSSWPLNIPPRRAYAPTLVVSTRPDRIFPAMPRAASTAATSTHAANTMYTGVGIPRPATTM